MRNDSFDIPVTVMAERVGLMDTVKDARAAAKVLLTRWPAAKREGLRYEAAKRACLDALEGRQSGAVARKAFTAAAKEARIYVEPNAELRRLQGRGCHETRSE